MSFKHKYVPGHVPHCPACGSASDWVRYKTVTTHQHINGTLDEFPKDPVFECVSCGHRPDESDWIHSQLYHLFRERDWSNEWANVRAAR